MPPWLLLRRGYGSGARGQGQKSSNSIFAPAAALQGGQVIARWKPTILPAGWKSNAPRCGGRCGRQRALTDQPSAHVAAKTTERPQQQKFALPELKHRPRSRLLSRSGGNSWLRIFRRHLFALRVLASVDVCGCPKLSNTLALLRRGAQHVFGHGVTLRRPFPCASSRRRISRPPAALAPTQLSTIVDPALTTRRRHANL